MSDLQKRLRALPSVSKLLERADVAAWLAKHPRSDVTDALRAAVDGVRASLSGAAAAPADASLPDDDAIVASADAHLRRALRPGLHRVVNGTGIVLHTGLGRAVLPKAAIDALAAEAAGYCLLAIDDDTNQRGRRERFCESILRDLTGCEAATVVNNNAAAVLLVLNTMAVGKEVVVSRGQLVEIGGAFRMPDVMARAGCRMVEVGCTNRTHLRDYAAAITADTAALIRVHPSNYRVQGFASEVPIGELVELGHQRGVPVIDDLGSGALVRLGLADDEPLVADSLKAGADVVTCSADKLIGGPQGGILLGSKRWIEACDDNQLARALRAGKLDLIALEATLRMFRDPETLGRDHPTVRMLTETKDAVAKRAQALARKLRARLPDLVLDVIDSPAYAGSGALPVHEIPSKAVAVTPPAGLSADDAARKLRVGDPSVFVRIADGRLIVDARTIQPGEESDVVAAFLGLNG